MDMSILFSPCSSCNDRTERGITSHSTEESDSWTGCVAGGINIHTHSFEYRLDVQTTTVDSKKKKVVLHW